MSHKILVLKELAEYLKITEKQLYMLAIEGKRTVLRAGVIGASNFPK